MFNCALSYFYLLPLIFYLLPLTSLPLSYFYLLDSWMSGFGEEVLRHVPATSAMLEELVNKTERLYVLTKNPVQDEGYVANLELNVLQAGPMYVQVSDTKKFFLYGLRLLNLLRFPKLFLSQSMDGN